MNHDFRRIKPNIMRNITFYFSVLFLTLSFITIGQSAFKSKKDKLGRTYQYVENDPLNARIYTLENGLKVYLTVYKNEPRIQTYVAVRAGSKNDPADHTGLAHYLEHILFKGTSKIGTHNWTAEKPLLEEIERLYNVYGATTDTSERTKIYKQIDSVSGVAATYAIANEYDKMLSNIGAQGTNAYTWFEQTVYVNDIPSNEIEKWSQIEGERFGEVVPRLFHTELEAVYEEKNRGLDSDNRKAWEAMFDGMFQKHQYGTQTTIGTIDHLKSPSITAIKAYFKKHYIANNMAVCLSGDFDPAEAAKLIAANFSKLPKGKVENFVVAKESPITAPVIKEVKGPDAESVSIGFRLPGRDTEDALLMELMSMVLSNSQAGLIDINLNQKQAVLGAYAFPLRLRDYSTLILGGRAKEGQSLDQTRDLLLTQVELIKKGQFDDWLLPAIINDYKLSQTIEYESNKNRADAFVQSFIYHTPWDKYVGEIERLEKFTKADIVSFANKYFNDNYVIVYKRTGEDKVTKVPKPAITPVTVNREQQSDFYQKTFAQASQEIKPVFLDFEKDIVKGTLANNIELLYNQNVENDLFELFYVFDIGTDHNPQLGIAIQYLNYIGSDKLSAEEIKKEFYKIGCNFSVHSASDQVYVSLNGLNENFEAALKLFEEFLASPKADPEALKELIGRTLKSREDAKLDKRTILTKGLVSYAKYGPKSQFTNILVKEDFDKITGKDLTVLIKDIYNYDHRVLYYGPLTTNDLTKTLDKHHQTPTTKKPTPAKTTYPELPISENHVYFVDYDMVQSEVIFLSKSKQYDPLLVPSAQLFNEYFGGNMGSIVFQEMRESKALAYAVRSYYSVAGKKEESNYVVSYIGTQADKLQEAITGMHELLADMPESENSFANAKESIRSSMATQRITKSGQLFTYERAKKLGLDYDIRKSVYDYVQKATIEDVKRFHEEYVKGQKEAMLVIGSKDNVDLKLLSKYGKVTTLTLEEVFGY